MITLIIILALIHIITIRLVFVFADSIEYYLSGLNDFIFILLLNFPVINTIVVTGVLIIIVIKKLCGKLNN